MTQTETEQVLQTYTNDFGTVRAILDLDDGKVNVEAANLTGRLSYPFRYSDGHVILDSGFEGLEPLVKEAFVLAAETEERTRFIQFPPHFKVTAVDVTNHCDEAWLKENGITAVEEIWLWDDARRTHICSFQGSIEGHYVTQRITVEDGVSDEDRDQAEGELNPPDQDVDYFSSMDGDTHDFGVLPAAEVTNLISGEITYDEVLESFLEYCRCNEVI